jgi:hypothetical protein
VSRLVIEWPLMHNDTSIGTRTPVSVRFGARNWDLAVGGSLTFGRAGDCNIVISSQTPDLMVSRRAGRLTAVEAGLLVSNESTRRPLFLQGIPGPEFEIKPRMTLGTMPFERCRVVMLGSHAARYVFDITCCAAAGGTPGEPGPVAVPAIGAPTTSGHLRLELPASQRRYLAALCEPILTSIGANPVPPTYGQIAGRCGVSPRTVRNSLDGLRQMLSAAYGIPGLVHAGDHPGAVNFLSALGSWAVHSGNVTPDDLETLEP